MINFISTFPPIMCGIGTYTKYLASKMPEESYQVTSFRIDEFLKTKDLTNSRVSYILSLSSLTLPPLEGDVLWFQHAFGMWGRNPSNFLKFVKEGKKQRKKIIASLHTIHFQSNETLEGMEKKEKDLLEGILPLVDVLTVFTSGAYNAVVKAFPEYKDKIVVLRHGVHLYPNMNQFESRKKLLEYLINQAEISKEKKKELRSIYNLFFERKVIFLGNFGFVTQDKDPLQIYKLRKILQRKLPNYKVIALFIGRIQKRKDKKMERYLPLLERLNSIHDGEENLFYEDYISEEIFPFAFRALDFAVFWCKNATQSGRMAHAQGTNTCVVGRNIEGIGETLRLSGLPTADTLEELAEKIERFVLEPKERKSMMESSNRYAKEFSYQAQAKKHLLLEKIVLRGEKLPPLDYIHNLPKVG